MMQLKHDDREDIIRELLGRTIDGQFYSEEELRSFITKWEEADGWNEAVELSRKCRRKGRVCLLDLLAVIREFIRSQLD